MKKILLSFCAFFLFSFIALADDVSGIVKDASMPNCADGKIDLTVNGGFAPYAFYWTGPANFMAATEDIFNIKPGHYSVTVTDALCGEAVVDFNVGYVDADIYVSDKVNIEQCGHWGTEGVGSISLSIPGPGYSFNWSGPNGFSSTNQNISNLTEPGHYVVTITNSSGCTKVLEDNICCCKIDSNSHLWEPPSSYICSTGTSSPALTIQSAILVSPSGNNTMDGSINVTVGTGDYNFYYNWSGPNGYTSHTQDISNLNPGKYCVTVSTGCQTTVACYTLVVCSESTLAISGVADNTCANFTAGSVTVTASGGNPPYKYKWSNGANSSSINNLGTGQYCVTLTDASGCTRTGCYTVGTKNPIVSKTTIPCKITETCNGQTHEQPFNYEQHLVCNTLYRYCPATGQTIIENLGWASAYISGCTLYGVCQDGSTKVIEYGSNVSGPFAVSDPNCPYGVGCVSSACYFPTYGLALSPETPTYCSYVTFEQGNCSEGYCFARFYCDNTIVDQGCVKYPICSTPKPNDIKSINLFEALKLKNIVYNDQELLELVNNTTAKQRAENGVAQGSHGINQQATNSNSIVSNIFPNPFSDDFIVKIESQENSEIRIDVNNVLGSTVYSTSILLEEGTNETAIKIPSLPSSLYFVQIYQKGLLIGTYKVVKE